MKLLIQRVSQAQVKVNEEITGQISNGLLVFIGITHKDTHQEADWLAQKLLNLRIFEDLQHKLHYSVLDLNYQILVVSQFTLYADCMLGRRPSFFDAANPKHAFELYEYFIKLLQTSGLQIQTGVFGANMSVELKNEGPFSLILEK